MEYLVVIAIITMIIYTVLQNKNYQKTQTELTNFARSLERIGYSLLEFNSQLEANAKESKQTLAQINISYRGIEETMKAIAKMKTEEVAEYSLRKQIISQAAITFDSALTESVNTFTTTSQNQLALVKKNSSVIDDSMREILEKMREHTETQLDEFRRAIVTQKDNLLKKLEEDTILAEELRNLTSIKQGITAFESATLEQNQKIDNLCALIEQFIETQGQGEKKSSFISKLTGK